MSVMVGRVVLPDLARLTQTDRLSCAGKENGIFLGFSFALISVVLFRIVSRPLAQSLITLSTVLQYWKRNTVH